MQMVGQVDIQLCEETCLIGIKHKSIQVWQWNWLSLQLKQYLYTMQRAEKKPTILVFKATLRATVAVIKAGHKTDREKESFAKYWSAWEKVFDEKK